MSASSWVWKREPFYGGCHYVAQNGVIVSGYYSPSNPTEYESDCKAWSASNLRGPAFIQGQGRVESVFFSSADQAMAAAEARGES